MDLVLAGLVSDNSTEARVILQALSSSKRLASYFMLGRKMPVLDQNQHLIDLLQ